ncbi:hydrogenase nickel incorporation protein HypB [Azoarcus sp. KH32C]|uniref:hydrogenase nickel incorporation protein HypB n=1 Tax=Azoarcus sp. KH32C TaxID=748247 RepID=UPI0002386F27|nr:hydrogenase nickel incorporation protein HypB [Azoarcus sp. KH32C]BAL26078.1 hydrogenase accessory protein [Azoarcus sp. KH32C]
MCTVCGCGAGEVNIGGAGHSKPARPKEGTTRAWKPAAPAHEHTHDGQPSARDASHIHSDQHHLHFGAGPAHAHAPGLSQSQMVKIERDILGKNDACADANRRQLAARGIFALNLVSSPGSGKTTLLVRTLTELAGRVSAAVVEGDQQTEFDAERIRATGVPALQINTGKGCHLDADMVGRALAQMQLADDSLLLIENVGNLVCPAAFDLGEAHKVAILSVTEGEDKPLKYPDMFAAADLMLLNKVDLLPHLTFDVERAIGYARRVNPAIEVIRTSSTSGEGIADWLAWLERGMAKARAARSTTVQPA